MFWICSISGWKFCTAGLLGLVDVGMSGIDMSDLRFVCLAFLDVYVWAAGLQDLGSQDGGLMAVLFVGLDFCSYGFLDEGCMHMQIHVLRCMDSWMWDFRM